MLDELYDIRDVKTEDENFIRATFLRGVYYGNPFFSLIPKQVFMDNYKKMSEMLLKDRTRTVVKVACLKEDQDVIIGYSILSADYQTIHYVYVKSAFRKQGIARSLVPKYPSSVSHMTEIGESLLNKFEGCVFNPFAI